MDCLGKRSRAKRRSTSEGVTLHVATKDFPPHRSKISSKKKKRPIGNKKKCGCEKTSSFITRRTISYYCCCSCLNTHCGRKKNTPKPSLIISYSSLIHHHSGIMKSLIQRSVKIVSRPRPIDRSISRPTDQPPIARRCQPNPPHFSDLMSQISALSGGKIQRTPNPPTHQPTHP